jgi:hypothetical protein
MLHLELELNELDYNALADLLLPLMAEELKKSGNPISALAANSPAMAKKLISSLPREQLDALAAQAINKNGPLMARRAEELGKEQGVGVRVVSVRAKAW